MASLTRLKSEIFRIHNEKAFQELALQIFQYQYSNNPLYRRLCDFLHTDADSVTQVEQIPFMPVSLFRNFRVLTGEPSIETIFASSGTTGKASSLHHVADLNLYEKSFCSCFRAFYGDPAQYCLLALLPSYLERGQSSLVYMANSLIQQTRHSDSGFYLHNYQKLYEKLLELKERKQKTILLGVTYALLDMAAEFPVEFPELIVMETGGMKGKRRELVREEVHDILRKGFGIEKIHSEYGMTELLSQAYSKGDGLFSTPPWMKVYIRDPNDPFSLYDCNKSGGINVVDLANVDSCSFLELQDLGRKHQDGQFEVIGRFDHSQVRGCNLLLGSL